MPAAAPGTGHTGLPPGSAPERCLQLRRHGRESGARQCFAALTRAASAWPRAEGYWGLGEYEQANDQFRAAVAADDRSALYRVRWGMLLHERFNDADAESLFKEALQRDPGDAPALLGLALVSAGGFDDQALVWARKALQADPALVPAHELLADLLLQDGDAAAASAEADRALALTTDALDAMGVHGTIELLADRDPEPWWARIRAVNAGYGGGFAIAARHLVLERRYREAVDYYHRALMADPQLWPARSELGVNLMRLGEDGEARAQLTQCYDHGYRDYATVNSLRLLDSLSNFVSFRDDVSILRLHRKEAAVLQPYVSVRLHQALTAYEHKYRMQLPWPVQVELYPDHEDFAVRALGLPGLGALGVTFGQLVVMDSPSGRRPGDFHWASTLRHELSHVFILEATHHRVPRWFTEGLAVHEQSQASPEWGDPITPDIVVALHERRLLPVTQLDQGFIRPAYPAQVLVSYFQAGRICDYIQERWGADRLLDLVHAFARPDTTAVAVTTVLGLAPAAFDRQFQDWLYARLPPVVGAFDEWRRRLGQLQLAAREQRYDEVVRDAPAVIALYPDYVEDANAYQVLADADQARGDVAGAAAALAQYVRHCGRLPGVFERLATLQERLGHPADAAATLARINDIDPLYDQDYHRRLGALWLAQGNFAGAELEFGTVLAMHPLDLAGAEYDLARTYAAAGDPARALDEVLKSLEAAPDFRPAQKLLLQLKGQ
ncbi:MAG TPA: hypothetical protein VMB48_11635 [Steroidobacteraceae bacterium]|nr:hypothetical protein [Steroidobacteraceae bacterium]